MATICLKLIFAGLLFFTAQPAIAQPVTAKAELDDAITVLKTYHINRAKVDWPTLELHAQEMISGKATASDAYPAIYYLIVQLGEKHTSLHTADRTKAMMTDQAVGSAHPYLTVLPEGHFLEGNIGLLTLPTDYGSPSDNISYAQAAQQAVQRFSDKHVCRFIVDLRANTGGSMYPMVDGVEALLGSPPYGYWQAENKPDTAWTDPSNQFYSAQAGKPLPHVPAASRDLASKSVVAVLIDHDTASAGEFTAIAFEGRPHTRIFGESTAGFLTSNMAHRLPDGALLAVSTGWSTDRLHRPYRSEIVPDEPAAKGQATFDAAVAWLNRQSCPND
ncbi:MAG TPA: S41 family peptidase [Rhizomicrobium sp.]|nr:S41 family peptidase [Rhizomicrobium sp.]